MDGADDLPASSILTRGPSPGLPVVLEGVFPGRMVLVPCNRHPESSQVWYNCHFRLVRMTKVVGEKQPLTNSCDHPAADGVRPQAVGTTAQPYTAGRPAPSRLTSAIRSDLQISSRHLASRARTPDGSRVRQFRPRRDRGIMRPEIMAVQARFAIGCQSASSDSEAPVHALLETDGCASYLPEPASQGHARPFSE